MRRNDDDVTASMSARLRRLGGWSVDDAPETPGSETDDAPQQRAIRAELEFVAGPRTGERLSLERRTVALTYDGTETSDATRSDIVASIWGQGTRFMLRHAGGISIGGLRPTLPVLTLEDGDEFAWGSNRVRFRIEEPPD